MADNEADHPVLIVAPMGQDAPAMAELFSGQGLNARTCSSLNHCVQNITHDTAVIVMTEEALEREHIHQLLQALREQPSWSELPMIVLIKGGEARRAAVMELTAAAPGSVTVLERPVQAATLLQALQVALRSRKRQYQVRELLEQQQRAAIERAQRADELERALAQRTEEVTLAERRLATTDRMAAVGTLASGLAHDMANVLMPLGTRLDMLLTHMSVDGATHDHLIAVQGLLTHLREMARNLSLFSRDPEHEGLIGQTNLSSWSKQTWRFLEASLRVPQSGASIRLDCHVPDDLPQVAIAPHRLTQIVFNLVHNARDAILTKRNQSAEAVKFPGRIEVKASKAAVAPNGSSTNGAVVLSVIDDGIGMDEQTRRRSIEPFFTTKTRPEYAGGTGSGQGLALVKGIVDRVGGQLDIESKPGSGTTVTVTLPTINPE